MSGMVVTFGEVMLRLAVPLGDRLTDTRVLEASYGGGEANVAVALAQTGAPTRFVTRLPADELGDAVVQRLRGLDVQMDSALRGGSRLGVYYLEPGAAQRPSKVVYDREGSAFAEIDPEELDWGELLHDARWFHTTGISPAVSEGAARAASAGAAAAAAAGIPVSVDLNYRAKLWRWGGDVGAVMSELVRHADVIVGNEEDAARVFGIQAPEVTPADGSLKLDAYRSVIHDLLRAFPKAGIVAFSLRSSHSASHNGWSGVAASRGGELLRGPSFEIHPIIDRVGAGDAFAAGLIRSLLNDFADLERALSLAVAASAIKHTVRGDLNLVNLAEVERLAAGDRSGRVLR